MTKDHMSDVAQPEKMPTSRPVAFRVPRVVDGKLSKTEFRLFDDEDEARRAACDIGADYDGLFLVADRRAAFFAQPDPRLSADRESQHKAYAEDWHRQIINAGGDENVAQQAITLAALNGLFDHINEPQAVRKPVVLEPLPTDRYAVDDPWHRPQSSDEQAGWRPSKEEIKKIILSAIESKADAEIYGVSSARKINGYRAVTATEAILALSRPQSRSGE